MIKVAYLLVYYYMAYVNVNISINLRLGTVSIIGEHKMFCVIGKRTGLKRFLRPLSP